jgi:hypothetical protein
MVKVKSDRLRVLLLSLLVLAQCGLVFETFGEKPSRDAAHQLVSHLNISDGHPHDPSFGVIDDSDHDHVPTTLVQDLGYGHVTGAFDSSEYYPDVSPLNDTLMGALTAPYKPPRWI